MPLGSKELKLLLCGGVLSISIVLASSASFAQSLGQFSNSWKFAPSGDLASRGWRMLGVTSMSWPDGRQAVMSFWRSPDGAETSRCIDYFDASMQEEGGSCEVVVFPTSFQ